MSTVYPSSSSRTENSPSQTRNSTATSIPNVLDPMSFEDCEARASTWETLLQKRLPPSNRAENMPTGMNPMQRLLSLGLGV